MGKKISLTIDGVRLEILGQENVLGELEMVVNKISTKVTVEVREGATVLEAAWEAGLYIPALCADPDLKPYGGCRLCLVEIEGRQGLHAACTARVAQGMVVRTDTDCVNEVRRQIVELMRSGWGHTCLLCPKYQACDFQTVLEYLRLGQPRLKKLNRPTGLDFGNPLFVLNRAKCILCAKCVRVCDELQGMSALKIVNDGLLSRVVITGDGQSACKSCGLKCVAMCPTAALLPKDFKWTDMKEKLSHPYRGTSHGIYMASGSQD